MHMDMMTNTMFLATCMEGGEAIDASPVCQDKKLNLGVFSGEIF